MLLYAINLLPLEQELSAQQNRSNFHPTMFTALICRDNENMDILYCMYFLVHLCLARRFDDF